VTKKMKKFFLNIFFLTLGLFASLIAIPAFAQTHITIATSVPGNYGAAAAGSSPGAYIANFYIFALIIGGILAFGVVVYGGVKYMASAGNPSGQSDAKEWIEAALLGLLLLVGVYFVLDVINPQLLNLNLPTLTAVNIVAPSSGTGSGPGGGGSSGNPSARCTAPASGPCSVANLQTTCMGSNAAMAGGVCNTESSGNAGAGGDLSTNIGPNGKPLPASVGLFQINLSANSIPYNCKDGSSGCLYCPDAFSNRFTGSNPHTTITNMTLYNQCAAAAKNPTTNITQACAMSKNGTNWNQWGPSTKTACGLN
jgi:hypothetical protein